MWTLDPNHKSRFINILDSYDIFGNTQYFLAFVNISMRRFITRKY